MSKSSSAAHNLAGELVKSADIAGTRSCPVWREKEGRMDGIPR